MRFFQMKGCNCFWHLLCSIFHCQIVAWGNTLDHPCETHKGRLEMGRSIICFCAFTALCLSTASPAYAYKACIGSNENVCKYHWDNKYWFACGAETEESAAKKICLDPITKKIRPYQILNHDSDASGGACGYTRFEVYCDEPANKIRFCIGEVSSLCPVTHDASYPCGTDPNVAAQGLCTVMDNGAKVTLPYRMGGHGSHSGNKCGYAWYEVQCFR
jgi:hypothetical protein